MKSSKNSLKRLLAVCLALCFLIICVCSCGKTENPISDDDANTSTSTDSSNDGSGDDSNVDSSDDSNIDSSDDPTPSSEPGESSTPGATTKAADGKTTKTTAGGNKPASGLKKGGTLTQLMKNVPSKLKGTQVFMYDWNEIDATSGVPQAMEKFTKQTGIKVKWGCGSYDNYATEISAMVAANKSPDVVRLKGLEHAIISNLQPLENTGYDFTEDCWDKNMTDYYTVNGKIYAANLKNTLIQCPTVLLYNSDTISKYDFEDPYALFKQGKWTWDTFKQMLIDYHKETGNPSWSPRSYVDIAAMSGQGFVKKDGDRFKNNMGSKELYNGCVEMCQMYQDGLIDAIPLNYGGIGNDKNLFLSESIIGARTTHFYFTTTKSNGALRTVPVPSHGGTYYQNYAECQAFGLVKGAKNPEGAYFFLRYYLDGDNYEKKTFFNDPTILDTYNWVMKQENIYTFDDNWVCTAEFGWGYRGMWLKIIQTKPDQIATLLSSLKGEVNEGVNASNKALEKIK